MKSGKSAWQEELSLYLSKKLGDLANVLTDHLRDGKVLRNRCAREGGRFAREFYIEANRRIVGNCEKAGLSPDFTNVFAYAYTMEKIRIFRESMANLDLDERYRRIAEESAFMGKKSLSGALDLAERIEDYIAGLSIREYDSLHDEMEMSVARFPPCVCLRADAALQGDLHFSLHLSPFVDGRQAAIKKTFGTVKSVFDMERVKASINRIFEKFFNDLNEEAEQSPGALLRHA